MSTGTTLERVRKQKYVQEEIINAGYEPKEFFEYLADRRSQGSDLDVWDFEELLRIGEDFITFKQAMLRLIIRGTEFQHAAFRKQQDPRNNAGLPRRAAHFAAGRLATGPQYHTSRPLKRKKKQFCLQGLTI